MSRLGTLTALTRRVGPREAALFLGLSAAQRVAALRILQVVAISTDRLDPCYLALDRGFASGFADREWLLEQAAADPGVGMDEAFIRDACARGDRCYAISAGGRLASYGWYSHHSTPIADGLVLDCEPSYVYMYKGFTRPEFRGRRLHASGMGRALEALTALGYAGLVSFVDRVNRASLRSVYRMGYRDVARYAVLAVRRTHLVLQLGGGLPQPAVTVRALRPDGALLPQ